MKAKPNRYVDNGDGSTTIVITKASGAEFECLIDTADVPIENMCNSKLLVSNSTCIKNVWFRNNNPRHSTFAVAEVRLGEERLKKEFNVSKLGLLEATYAAAKYARGLRNDLHGEFARHV